MASLGAPWRRHAQQALAALALAAVPRGATAGGSILFSTELDMTMIGWMLSAILIFTVVWEEAIERLEHYLSSNSLFMEMLGKVYRELMLLGFVSLSLILSKEFGFVSDHDLIISFEFAHLLVFGVAIVFIGNGIVSVFMLKSQQRNWDRIYHVPIEELVAYLKENELPSNATDGMRPLWSTLVPAICKSKRHHMWEELEWKALRVLFLKEFEFGSKFDYSQYMRQKLMQRLLHTLHIHPQTWGLVLIFTAITSTISEFLKGEVAKAYAPACSGCGCCGSNATNATNSSRRMLGGGGGGGGGISETRAIFDTLVPMMFAWFLLAVQMAMLFKLKSGVHALFRLKIGCSHTTELATALPKLAQDADEFDGHEAPPTAHKDDAEQGHGGNTAHSALPSAKGDGHGDAHHHGAEMVGASTILSHASMHKFEQLSEVCMLMNCFQLSYYFMHQIMVIIPAANFGVMEPLVHVFCVGPGLGLLCYVAPKTHTYFCLLCSVLWRDDEEIAKVIHATNLVVALRKNVQLALLKKGLEWGTFDTPDPTMAEVAKFVFQELDADGGGTLTYNEIRDGFPDFDIYLTRHEWTQLLRAIDPDQSGDLSEQEWEDFMVATEEDLMNEEWREFMVVKRTRDRIRAHLLTKIMEQSETNPGLNPREVAMELFDKLDVSRDGNLSKLELKAGLDSWDLEITQTEFDRVWEVIDVNNVDEMQRQEWVDFMAASDAELREVAHQNHVMGAKSLVPARGKPIAMVGVTDENGMSNPLATTKAQTFESARPGETGGRDRTV